MSKDLAKIKIKILIDGKSKVDVVSPSLTVVELIKQLLPSKNPDDYVLSLKDRQLKPELTLGENGIVDGSILSLTKKHGGGGSYLIIL